MGVGFRGGVLGSFILFACGFSVSVGLGLGVGVGVGVGVRFGVGVGVGAVLLDMLGKGGG